MSDFDFDFGVVWSSARILLRGLAISFEFTLICILLGGSLGFLIALLVHSRSPLLRVPGLVYVEVFRGTPVLIQLFWIFFALPLILGIELTNYASSIVALTLFMGAISSATYLSAFKSIPSEHRDAGIAIGLSGWQRVRFIIFPQAFRYSIPNLLSNSVSLFKESSLVSAVGMADLMYLGQAISNRTARPMEILTTVAIMYFLVAFPITRLVTLLEKRAITTQGN